MAQSAKPEVQQWIIDEAIAGAVACQIGHINSATVRALDKMVARGELAKWRGHWYPHAGAPFGIGPLKTCWGPITTRDHWASFALVTEVHTSMTRVA